MAKAIKRSQATIYDEVLPELLYDLAALEARLNAGLLGRTWDQHPRTRAKVAKQAVCDLLGYEAPLQFKKTVRPNVPSQNLDIYVQKSNNLQIWNDEVDPSRRYVLIRVDEANVIRRVRVISGTALAQLGGTGHLTTKYQAARHTSSLGSRLVSKADTDVLVPLLCRSPETSDAIRPSLPTAPPRAGDVRDIATLFRQLESLVGAQIPDPGVLDSRGRGVAMQRLVCQQLKLGDYVDGGQFPDVLCQLLEVKLQLSPTIDLGLVSPDSTEPLGGAGHGIRYCDTRYAVFYGQSVQEGSAIRIHTLVLSTGADFFSEFRRFEGRVQNAKLQIPLPADFF